MLTADMPQDEESDMAKVVRIARELGREVATPDEARIILGLKGRDKVNY